jgi:hypothetical protein
MEENNATTTSTKGKGLGTAGMVIGIVALVWAIIPLLGAGALWIAVIGLVLSIIAFVMAKNGNNPKKGMIIAGIVMNVVAVALAAFWAYKIASVAMDMKGDFEDAMKNIDTAAIRNSIEGAMENAANGDSTAH